MHRNCKNTVSRRVTRDFRAKNARKHLAGHNRVNINVENKRERKIRMSIETLKEEVLAANLDLVTKNLVISTWGNVSGYDGETGVMVIKASGVPYDKMTKEHMVTVDLDGNVIDSPYSPSTYNLCL